MNEHVTNMMTEQLMRNLIHLDHLAAIFFPHSNNMFQTKKTKKKSEINEE